MVGDEVSIPRSGFCSFRPQVPDCHGVQHLGFNPSFGILLIQTYVAALYECLPRCFNPSFGILLIQTPEEA